MDRGTKLAIGFGVGLTVFSLALIAIGDLTSYFASGFGYALGVQTGSSISMTGWAIIIVMLTIVLTIVAVWVYRQFRSQSSSPWGY
jgi:hypothetical protein